MSLARIYTTKTVRKDWVCGKCGKQIKKGVDGRLSFAVGFRGFERTRCLDTACYPTRAERESSALSSVYDAVDSVNFDGAETLDDLQSIRDDVAAAIREVAEEYESNEMYEVNYDLQERAETLNAAADDLEGWEPEEDEPEEDDPDSWEVDGNDTGDFEEAHNEWLDAAKQSLQDTINGLDLP